VETRIRTGQGLEIKRVFSQADFDRFAALSGDDNPIHVDPEFAARTRFGRTVAHGMLLYGAVCGALGTRLPGPGTLQREQELMFPNATYADEAVVVRLEVTRVQHRAGLADLNTTVIRPDGSVGLEGRTRVQLPGTSHFTPLNRSQVDPPANDRGGESFKGLALGQRAAFRRTFTSDELDAYADITGDTNPLFADADYARRAGLAARIVPGGLLGGLFSFLLGTQLPGPGTNYLKQRMVFDQPAYPGQPLTASVEIIRLRPEKQLVNLETTCRNSGGEVVCHGEALVLVSDVESATT
jgi:acyl dehydratase